MQEILMLIHYCCYPTQAWKYSYLWCSSAEDTRKYLKVYQNEDLTLAVKLAPEGSPHWLQDSPSLPGNVPGESCPVCMGGLGTSQPWLLLSSFLSRAMTCSVGLVVMSYLAGNPGTKSRTFIVRAWLSALQIFPAAGKKALFHLLHCLLLLPSSSFTFLMAATVIYCPENNVARCYLWF